MDSGLGAGAPPRNDTGQASSWNTTDYSMNNSVGVSSNSFSRWTNTAAS
jgi:hypothetical protein